MEYDHAIALQGRKAAPDAFSKFEEVNIMGDSYERDSHFKDIMIGKTDEFKTIKEMLIQHSSKQREVVSIKGMGGIGKTTLAKRVYEDPSIASYFDKRAWVVASQHHNKRQMLESLLASMGKAKTGSDEELALRLYQSLKGQRYMVVMDDVWSKEAWDDVKTCFPDDRNGSRVLLTTRLAEVDNYTCSKNDFSHQMHLLDQSESWNLFYEKTCRSRNAEFETIGRPIVEKCNGLPLAIVVVAGLFFKLNTLDEWKNIAEALNSSATTIIDEECSRILSLSYNHLPYNLKACFLYLSVFPEDQTIYANDLARLWAAEGLVKAFKNMSFETVAKRHIQELKDRNLILVCQPSSCGRNIKMFRMHDLLHAFCVRKAEDEYLLHVVRENVSNFPLKSFRWVSIQSKDFKVSLYSLNNSRSIFYFPPDTRFTDFNVSSSSNNSRSIFCFHPDTRFTDFNFKNFNLLRVLYRIEFSFANSVHLRYISLGAGLSSGHKFLKPFRAWNLQTFLSGYVVGNFFEFPQLQYLDCYCGGLSPKFKHRNLQRFSQLQSYECTEEFCKKLSCLKTLKILIAGGASNDLFKNLAHLKQLKNLCIYEFDSPLSVPVNRITHLTKLKKLKLVWIRLKGKIINILSKLSMLEVLKLWVTRWDAEGWDWELTEEAKFRQLICLKIRSLDLKRWKASACHFPKLERLFISQCERLEEIPAGFAEILTLKSIELDFCLRSAVTSAKKIQEDQHDQGNKDMVFIEYHTTEPKRLTKMSPMNLCLMTLRSREIKAEQRRLY